MGVILALHDGGFVQRRRKKVAEQLLDLRHGHAPVLVQQGDKRTHARPVLDRSLDALGKFALVLGATMGASAAIASEFFDVKLDLRKVKLLAAAVQGKFGGGA